MAKNSFKIDKSINLVPQASAPASPENGDIYYDSVLNQFRKYEDGAWSSIGADAGAVIGPGSSEDGELTVFDGIDGDAVRGGTGLIVPVAGKLATTEPIMKLGGDDSNDVLNIEDTAVDVFTALFAHDSLSVGQNATIEGTIMLPNASDGVLKNTSGMVSTGQVSLTSDVSGVLPADNGGDPNYIPNPYANNGTTGWAMYFNTPGGAPTTGTGGGSAFITLATTTSSPISGANSFLMSKTSTVANQGEGWSYTFNVDNAARAKVLDIEFDYVVNSGTLTAGTSNTSPGDIRVWIYDVTNSALIQPSTIWLGSTSTTAPERFRASFQSSATGSQYRLILHIGSTTTTQWALKVDNVKVRRSSYIYGTPITDWRVYTPAMTYASGTMTNHIVTGWWRRVGDVGEYNIFLNFVGAPGTWTQPRFSLPPGQVIDTSQQPLTNGDIKLTDTGSNVHTGIIFNASTTSVGIDALQATGSPPSVQGLSLNQASPFVWASNDEMRISFSRKIVGWSSSVQMSDSADTRVVACSVYASNIAYPGAGSVLIFPTKIQDTHNAFNTVTSQYTVPVSGYYRLSADVCFAHTGATGQYLNLAFYYNGSATGTTLTTTTAVASSGSIRAQIQPIVVLANAGATIDLRVNGTNVTGLTAGSGINSTFTVERISGPSAIAANEAVAVSAQSTSGQVIPLSTWTTITFNSVIDNSHNAYNASTGIFTVPVSGRYAIFSKVTCSNAGSIGTLSLRLIVNGGVNGAYGETITTTTNTNYNVYINTQDLKLNAGDQVRVDFHQNQNSPNVALPTAASFLSALSINRIGL